MRGNATHMSSRTEPSGYFVNDMQAWYPTLPSIRNRNSRTIFPSCVAALVTNVATTSAFSRHSQLKKSSHGCNHGLDLSITHKSVLDRREPLENRGIRRTCVVPPRTRRIAQVIGGRSRLQNRLVDNAQSLDSKAVYCEGNINLCTGLFRLRCKTGGVLGSVVTIGK